MVEGRVRESFGPTLDEWREQYCAKASVLLVHSFSEELAGWPDYGVFHRSLRCESCSWLRSAAD